MNTEESYENTEVPVADSSYVPYIYYQELLGISPKQKQLKEELNNAEDEEEEEQSHYSVLRSTLTEENITLKEALEKIKVLEDVCAHLNNQMKIMKKLISAQINETRRNAEDQVNECKHLIVVQNKLFQEKIVELESRLESQTQENNKRFMETNRILSPMYSKTIDGLNIDTHSRSVPAFPQKITDLIDGMIKSPALKKAREVNHTEITPQRNRPASPPKQSNTEVADEKLDKGKEKNDQHIDFNSSWMSSRSIVTPSASTIFHEREEKKKVNILELNQDLMSKDTNYVLKMYRPILIEVYNFYCQIYWGYTKGRISLNKTQFQKFYRDCCLVNVIKETSYELLWVKVLRVCKLAKSNHMSEIQGKELTEEHFEQSLLVIAGEVYKRNTTYTEAQRLEAFLITHVLPNVTPLIQASKEVQDSNQANKGNASAGFAPSDYSEQVKTSIDKLFKKNRKNLQIIYKKYLYGKRKKTNNTVLPLKGTGPKFDQYRDQEGMTLKGLIDFCMEHGILRLITKKDLSTIHAMRAGKDPKRQSKLHEDILSYEGFEDALLDIANAVYGGMSFKNHYPTLDLRLEKLFTKIFVLSDKLNSGASTITSVSNNFKDSFREPQ